MNNFATIEDVINLFRKLDSEEIERATALLPIVCDSLRVEAKKVGKDLDKLAEDSAFANVVKSVVVDIISRTLLTSTNNEPMIQTSESALGYSFSGTFLNPGGGLFIKNSELSRLGLKKQRYGVINFYE
ncbi:phage Gp19/Gp15/Gp42 family protein [uncultured Parvimonas sp.]|uniref:phage Gp19/Gp15/Gp42 family protein n=1 Tax=uncultured Parvimonas sp. TaxID=747372 RepID=UPI00325FD552